MWRTCLSSFTVPPLHIVVSHDGGSVFTAGSRLTVTCTIIVDSALASNRVGIRGRWSAQNQYCLYPSICDFSTHPKDLRVTASEGEQMLVNGIHVRNITLVFDGLYTAHGDIYTCHASAYYVERQRSAQSSSAIGITVQGTVEQN